MMRDDIVKLRDYMQRHHERLDTDIQNALRKNRDEDAKFYEGGQNATHLFIGLLDDIIEKHS
jgi:hypothetical protein